MKYILLSYLYLTASVFGASIRQQSTVNLQIYTANVTTEFLSKHSTFPNDLNHIENLKRIEQVAVDYINRNFDTDIDPAKVSETFRSVEFRTITEGESTYYYVVYFIGIEKGGIFDYYRIPLAPDHTVIAPTPINKQS